MVAVVETKPDAKPVDILITDTARKEAVKTADMIYDEVVIDDINEELLKSA